MINPVKNAYKNKYAKNYDARRFTKPQGQGFHKLELDQLLQAIDMLDTPSKILEVGCGTGRFLEELADKGHQLTGLDASQDMLTLTQEKTGSNANLALGEGAYLPFENDHFDLVYSIRVLNQTESEFYAYKTIDEIIRVTKPGGLMLIEFVNRLRPSSLKKGGVALSIKALKQVVDSSSLVETVRFGGMLLFSETLLTKIPSPLLPSWMQMEQNLANRFPQFAARCYLLLKKTQPTTRAH